MTTKSDHVGSVLQSLAAIISSNPSHDLLYKIAVIMAKFQAVADPTDHNTVVSVDDAKEIIADYLDAEEAK